MLCSIPTPKSSNNWLDRLRSSRGFPAAATDLDLDRALSAPSDPPDIAPDSSSPVDHSKSAAASSHNGDPRAWVGIMSSVLAELFVIGDSGSHVCPKKSSRKQRNPKICAISKPPFGGAEEDDDFIGGGSREEAKEITAGRDNADCEEGEGGERFDDLKAFSRTEVTVIDTSCPSWKFDKMLFRRKSVWKVGEKMCKGASAGGGKKRKAPSSSDPQNTQSTGGGRKPPEVSILSLAASKQYTVPSHAERSQQDDERVEPSRTADVNQVPNKRRFPYSRSPRNLRKGGLPVVLVKGGPTDHKNGANIA